MTRVWAVLSELDDLVKHLGDRDQVRGIWKEEGTEQEDFPSLCL